jgi:hypothetical protein
MPAIVLYLEPALLDIDVLDRKLLILFVAQRKPSRGHLASNRDAVLLFYSGPLMHFLSGVDRRPPFDTLFPLLPGARIA